MKLPNSEMKAFETILRRPSVRSFGSEHVDTKLINTILEAANYAPVTNLSDPRTFIVIQDKQSVLSLLDSDISPTRASSDRPFFRREVKSSEADSLLNADALILIGGKSNSPSHIADCWLAAGNLILAAASMGLGTMVIKESMITFNFNMNKNKLKIPADFVLVASIAVGYPEEVMPQVLSEKPCITSWLSA